LGIASSGGRTAAPLQVGARVEPRTRSAHTKDLIGLLRLVSSGTGRKAALAGFARERRHQPELSRRWFIGSRAVDRCVWVGNDDGSPWIR